MTLNLHVCTIYCRPEVLYDVISCRNVETTEGYLVINFEVPSSSGFRDIQKNHIVTAEAIALSENAFAFRLKISVKIVLFLSHCRSRISRTKQQKLALPISPTLNSYNGRQLILKT